MLPTNHSCALGLITAIVRAKPPPTPIILLFEWMGYSAYGKDSGDMNRSQVFCGHDNVSVCMFCQRQGHGYVDKHHAFGKSLESHPLTPTASSKDLCCFPYMAALGQCINRGGRGAVLGYCHGAGSVFNRAVHAEYPDGSLQTGRVGSFPLFSQEKPQQCY